MTVIFDWIAGIFKYPMQLFYNWTGESYLLALILFALLVKIIMIPMSIQQQKTQIKGAKLRPKIAIIEKKYAGRTDRDAMQQKQQEIMEMQQKEGYSPLSGCLPLLIQLPVLLGLYQVIRKPLTYMMNMSEDVISKLVEHANSFLGEGGTPFTVDAAEQLSLIHALRGRDLSHIEGAALPDMTLFDGAIDLSMTPSIGLNWLILIPILTAVLSFLSMKVTRWVNPNMAAMASSPEQKTSNMIMDLTMPLMGVWIAFSVPAAVGFYWLMGYVFGILQTLILAKAMPLPTFTEEEIRQYEKEMKASRAKSARTYSDHMPPRRSLHHIDDDIPEVKEQPKSQPKKNAKPIAGIEAAPKKDDKNENA